MATETKKIQKQISDFTKKKTEKKLVLKIARPTEQ